MELLKNSYNVNLFYERVKNDIYGNPMYKVIMLDPDNENITYLLKGRAHVTRCYSSKGYALVQSYNIEKDLNRILDKALNVPYPVD